LQLAQDASVGIAPESTQDSLGAPGPYHPAEAQASPATDPAGPLARHVGTLVHRYLEWMARDGLAQWPLSRLQALEVSMTRWFSAQGHPGDEAENGARQTLHHLRQTLASEDGRWVLAAHEQAACELPLTTLRDGTATAHVVDRTFVVNGVRWIIDYKTAAGAGPGGALSETQQTSYRAQLERYRQLFPGQPVQGGVFLTDPGRLVVL
jgi:ATP-dependent helicase/nuclease subunit A